MTMRMTRVAWNGIMRERNEKKQTRHDSELLTVEDRIKKSLPPIEQLSRSPRPRNARCACGSGLKAKNCCLGKEVQDAIDTRLAEQDSAKQVVEESTPVAVHNPFDDLFGGGAGVDGGAGEAAGDTSGALGHVPGSDLVPASDALRHQFSDDLQGLTARENPHADA